MAKLKKGSKVFTNWKVVQEIGSGTFGNVYEIEREDFGVTYKAALKVISVPHNISELNNVLAEGMSQDEAKEYFRSVVEELTQEFSLMNLLKGKTNIVSYEDHLVVEHKDSIGWDIYVRMEILTPLLQYAMTNRMTKRDIIKLGIDICTALEVCQKYNIIHRDIKPENIFVSKDGDYKLGDFGIARTVEKSSAGLSKKGTYKYMAPEVYRGDEYGYSVDIYSLGIVLYRLLNKNRTPFLPEYPEKITTTMDENAIRYRVSGKQIPFPFYDNGRLGEIILKACAFDPKDRYSSPGLMKEELQAILYDADEANYIYPNGDEVIIAKNSYVEEEKEEDELENDADEATALVFSNKKNNKKINKTEADTTVGVFDAKQDYDEDKTQVVFHKVKEEPKKKEKDVNTKKTKNKIIIIVAIVCLLVGAGAGAYVYITNRNKKYEEYMAAGDEEYISNPEEALNDYLSAQELKPDDSEAYLSYAYTLFVNRDYEECIEYIENDLNKGKDFEQDVQNKLFEFLGSSYFELKSYAEAASYFSLSVDSDDITVDSMRDYAVSLGRLGDIDEAERIVDKMIAAGSSSLTTDYVHAEIDYAQGQYATAAEEIASIQSQTDDEKLYIRCGKTLAEIYRECTKMVLRKESSPIDDPTGKEIDVLNDLITNHNMLSDVTVIEMLANAYYNYYMQGYYQSGYLTKSAEYFEMVLEEGMKQEYLYDDLYTIYYTMGDYNKALDLLSRYEEEYPNYYKPNTFRGILYISIENNKDQDSRNYANAYSEYQKAESKAKSDDDLSVYNQLANLINQLITKGWLS